MKIICINSIGYMLKVMKNKKIIKFKDEFNCIRHSNYDDFFSLMNNNYSDIEYPYIIESGVNGIQTSDKMSRKSGSSDFGLLLKCGHSCKKFYSECKKIYGNIYDNDISNDIYYKLAYFEISIRMHVNNKNIVDNNKEKLIVFIDKLCKYLNIPDNEKIKIHNGRHFLNDIKHTRESNHKNFFNSWLDGIKEFEKSIDILKKYKISIL